MIEHPTLYKLASSGAIQQWTVRVDGNTILKEWGQVGGAIQTTSDTIKSGKNEGKANATTAEQQAEAEAAAMWEKKLKKDYVKTIEEAKSGASSDLIEGGILPMLAHRYDKFPDKITFPAFAQPKLDGHRCIAIIEGGKCTLWSRTRKPIYSMNHIIAAVEAMAQRHGWKDGMLDGELYNNDYHDNFEYLSHFIRQSKTISGCDVVQYHIYDCPIATDSFKLRNTFLGTMFVGEPEQSPLVQVETIVVKTDKELMTAFDNWLELGYEGAIVRNSLGSYLNTRSYDLQKVKVFEDDEFTCVGVNEGRGKLAGHAIFICRIPDDYKDPRAQPGAEFEAKMKGKQAKLKPYWVHPETAIGREITVQFQGFTKKEKVPRFGVALRFKEEL